MTDVALSQVWVANQIRADTGKELAKLFTYDAFETIINILERYTAFSRDPIPLVSLQLFSFCLQYSGLRGITF